MQLIPVKDFRDNLSQLIEEVAIGKQVLAVTKFNRPKVLVIPITEELTSIDNKKIDFRSLPGFGLWKKRLGAQSTANYAREIRKKQSYRQYTN